MAPAKDDYEDEIVGFGAKTRNNGVSVYLFQIAKC